MYTAKDLNGLKFLDLGPIESNNNANVTGKLTELPNLNLFRFNITNGRLSFNIS